MRKLLATLLTIASLSLTLSAFSWTTVVKSVTPSILRMEGTDWGETHVTPDWCTAVVVAPGRAITAHHCVREAIKDDERYNADYQLYLNGEDATLLTYEKFPEADGIALLGFTPQHERAIVFAKHPIRMGYETMGMGYGYGFPLMAQFGHVQLPHGPNGMGFVDMTFYPGDSGGPVVDVHGHMIGMMILIYSEIPQAHFGEMLSVSQITGFLHANQIHVTTSLRTHR